VSNKHSNQALVTHWQTS